MLRAQRRRVSKGIVLPETPIAPETVVSRWIDFFNLRDLEGMLECMSHEVRFYPLRLSGLERCYTGHDGVRAWFGRMLEHGHSHRIAIHNLRAEPDGEVVAVGELHLDEGADPARFWARDQVADDGIAVAHHYLTDPEIFEGIAAPQRRVRPQRFRGR